jgi:CRISPR-associated protein Csc3
MSDYLQFLGIEEQPVLTQFIEKVANKGLQQYQQIIQWGGHKGQSLYNHVISGVFLIYSLTSILKLSDEELKVLTIAFCIHDLNKSYGGIDASYSKIATTENVIKEIEKVGYDDFFPNWRDYVEDITEIIRGHSGHNSVRGDSLDRRSDPTRLGKGKVIELCKIIRAADVADLSQGYSERKHKEDFLGHINSFTKQQYSFIAHKVSEQRGILTNIIHNQIAEYLFDKFQAIPIFLYPQGTHYLVPVGKEKLTISEDNLLKIGQLVAEKIAQIKSDEWSKFIENGNQGIKIKKEIFNLSISYPKIFAHINTLIQKKKYNLGDKEEECRKKLKAKNSELEIKGLIEQDRIMPNSQEEMRLGELLRTFYIFLSDHCKKSLAKAKGGCSEPWLYIYQALQIPESKDYKFLHTRYDLAYVVAKNLPISYEELLNWVIEQANILLPIDKKEESELQLETSSKDDINVVSSYVVNNISFDFTDLRELSIRDFSKHLITYCQNNHEQSCYASSAEKTKKWESVYVPKGIKVQQFSNRLTGGKESEPRRHIDPIAQQQFTIEKLNYKSAGDKFLYLHVMPYSFMTAPFIESFRSIFQKLKQIDVSAVSISLKQTLEFFKKENYYQIAIKHENAQGILVPNNSEVVGNIISLPLSVVGNNKTEKYLNAIEYTLMIHKHFGVKVLLSELAIPILNLTEHSEIDVFLDGVPSGLRGLVPSEEIRFQRDPKKEPIGNGDVLWQTLLAIREIHEILHILPKNKDPNKKKISDLEEIYTLATAFSRSESRIFFELDRLIEKKAADIKQKNKESTCIYLTRQIKECMNQIMTVRNNL